MLRFLLRVVARVLIGCKKAITWCTVQAVVKASSKSRLMGMGKFLPQGSKTPERISIKLEMYTAVHKKAVHFITLEKLV